MNAGHLRTGGHSLVPESRIAPKGNVSFAGTATVKSLKKKKNVESPEGILPPGAPRTVRDRLDSYGSRCSAVAMAWRPIGKEVRVRSAQPIEPVSGTFGSMEQPLVFSAGPSDDIGVDPYQGRTQLRLNCLGVEMRYVAEIFSGFSQSSFNWCQQHRQNNGVSQRRPSHLAVVGESQDLTTMPPATASID